MRTPLLATVLASLLVSGTTYAEEMSASGWYATSSAVVSVGSSALVSGIILSPVLLPVSLVMTSIEKNDKQKTARITAKTTDKKDVQMDVPLKVVDEGKLKAGDKVTLEKAPEGTGAYLKKDGKVLTHMVTQEDSGLSGSQTIPAK
jgi:hypothetical protein